MTYFNELLDKLIQNCGPRPSGPSYPAPPDEGTGNPHDIIACDIVRDAQYVAGYKCQAPCQINPSMEVCFRQFHKVLTRSDMGANIIL